MSQDYDELHIPFMNVHEEILKSVEAILRQVRTNQVPDWEDLVVYHYCDAGALLSILRNHTLWATDMAFMNDAQEIAYGLSLFQCLQMKPIKEDWITKIFADFFDELRGQDLDSFTEHWYCCCFTRGSDKLSQWRGYADNGRGYAVGIKVRDLIPSFKVDGKFLGFPASIIYDKDTQEKLVVSIVQTIQNIIVRNVPTDSRLLADYEEMTKDAIRHVINITSPMMKNPGFAEEEEFRYLVPPLLVENSTLKFRTRNGIIIPYFELKPNSGQKLPISEIVVGPCVDFDKASYSIKKILEQVDHQEMMIKKSSVPYLP